MQNKITPQTLSEESFKTILEFLSENVHNQWMAKRLAEGWKFGPERNDIKKEHPYLIPYKKLPEEEKEYDRHTALAAIRGLIVCGYEITN